MLYLKVHPMFYMYQPADIWSLSKSSRQLNQICNSSNDKMHILKNYMWQYGIYTENIIVHLFHCVKNNRSTDRLITIILEIRYTEIQNNLQSVSKRIGYSDLVWF